MGNFAVLGGLFIKAFIIVLPILFLTLFLITRKSKIIAIIFFVLFLLTLALGFYFFISQHDRKRNESKRFLGYYKLDRFDCKECENCKLLLHDNFQYDIVKNDKIVGNGKWDLAYDYEEGGYYLSFDNDSREIIDETKREITSVDTKNCCIINCNENLQESLSGKIIKIGTEANYFGQKAIFILTSIGDTIKYYPKYYSHPWFEDKLQIGDFFSKEKSTMNFKIVHANEDTIFLNYSSPNCEEICNVDKTLKTLRDSLENARK